MMSTKKWRHGVSRSANVTDAAVVALTDFGFSQDDIDLADGVLVFNHSAASTVLFVAGEPASPPGGPYTKEEVAGAGLVERLPADTPVSTASAEHGLIIPTESGIELQGVINVRRLRLIAHSGTCRVTATLLAGEA